MPLPYATLKKLLHEHVGHAPPLVMSEPEWATLAETLRAHLSAIPGMSPQVRQVAEVPPSPQASRYPQPTRPPPSPPRTVLDLDYPQPGRSWDQNAFHVQRGPAGEIGVTRYHSRDIEAKVGSAEEVIALAQAIAEGVARRRALEERRTKVRGLKAQAILATVRRIAEEDGFVFYAGADTRKLKLFVALGGSDFLELHIEFSKFQEQLPRLRESIRLLRELHAQGVAFRLNRREPRGYDVQWTNHPNGDPKAPRPR